jgi:phage FluMu protein Com
MPRRPEPPGTCAFCNEVITRRSIAKHLEKCPKWQEILKTTEVSNRPVEILWHLRVQDAHDKDFWLDLEMVSSASLDKLDKYLRAIWLECCGHVSKFTIGGWDGMDVGKSRKANSIFEAGLVLRHLYDFGTTSETDIKVVGFRKGKPTSKHPIALLARNLMTEAACQECGQPAIWLCIECLYEEDKSGYLCDEHVEEHPHDNYGEPMQLFNSPRTGMCGYEGPAEPPY